MAIISKQASKWARPLASCGALAIVLAISLLLPQMARSMNQLSMDNVERTLSPDELEAIRAQPDTEDEDEAAALFAAHRVATDLSAGPTSVVLDTMDFVHDYAARSIPSGALPATSFVSLWRTFEGADASTSQYQKDWEAKQQSDSRGEDGRAECQDGPDPILGFDAWVSHGTNRAECEMAVNEGKTLCDMLVLESLGCQQDITSGPPPQGTLLISLVAIKATCSQTCEQLQEQINAKDACEATETQSRWYLVIGSRVHDRPNPTAPEYNPCEDMLELWSSKFGFNPCTFEPTRERISFACCSSCKAFQKKQDAQAPELERQKLKLGDRVYWHGGDAVDDKGQHLTNGLEGEIHLFQDDGIVVVNFNNPGSPPTQLTRVELKNLEAAPLSQEPSKQPEEPSRPGAVPVEETEVSASAQVPASGAPPADLPEADATAKAPAAEAAAEAPVEPAVAVAPVPGAEPSEAAAAETPAEGPVVEAPAKAPAAEASSKNSADENLSCRTSLGLIASLLWISRLALQESS